MEEMKEGGLEPGEQVWALSKDLVTTLREIKVFYFDFSIINIDHYYFEYIAILIY